MPLGEGYPCEVLLTFDPADLRGRTLFSAGCEGGGVAGDGGGILQRADGVSDHLARIADQVEFAEIQRLGQFQRPDQRQPLGVAVGAGPEILVEILGSSDDDRGLDASRVRAAAAVEENLDRAGQGRFLAGGLRCGRLPERRSWQSPGESAPIAPKTTHFVVLRAHGLGKSANFRWPVTQRRSRSCFVTHDGRYYE